jgi:threonine dehydratase
VLVSVERIELASRCIDPVFRSSPQYVDAALSRRLGRDVLVKVECLNPIRSFKGRGTDWLMRTVTPGQRLVCASAGNFGQGMAYAGAARGVPVTVFAASTATAEKIERMRDLGAEVHLVGQDYDAAKAYARGWAREHAAAGWRWVEDGADDAITEGAGTIGVELSPLRLDSLLVPVGNGALICGVATWLAHTSATTRVIGVCAAGAPAMLESWQTGHVINHDSIDTCAEGIGVRAPIDTAVQNMRRLVHEFVAVDDAAILGAVQDVHDTLGIMLEPAAAVGIAAIRQHNPPGDQVGTNFPAHLDPRSGGARVARRSARGSTQRVGRLCEHAASCVSGPAG